MKDPVDHIQRPQLPWRQEASVTECGINALKIVTLTRDEFFQRIKDMGKQRTAMITCMTCSDTAQRWGTWESDPRKALEREIQWETQYRRIDRGERLKDELLAIADLIEAHAEEFAAHIAAAESRREWNMKKDAMDRKNRVTERNNKSWKPL